MSNTRVTIWIAICFIASIGVVGGFWALSSDIRSRPGTFLRQYPPQPVAPSKMIALPDEPYYIAGFSDASIYLANSRKPLELLKIREDMSDIATVHLDIDGLEGSEYFRITVVVDSPYFFLMDGGIPYMYRGNLDDWIGYPFMYDSTYFVDAIPISGNAFAIRAMSTKTREYALGKLIVNQSVRLNYDLLERQFDGLFDVNGSMAFDPVTRRVSFVYYYRNQYMVLDTNMNPVVRGNTIDTFKTALIKSEKVESEKGTRLASPPMITNSGHDVYREWIFIHSLLPAKNEPMETFKNASVVDVYRLDNQSYELSFHVFDEGGKKMKEFEIVKDKMFVLFSGSIRKFDLIEKYFDHGQTDIEESIPD